MNVKIDIGGKLKPGVARVVSALEGEGRIELNHAMGLEVQAVTYHHLRDLAGSRHNTADRLGASPTGFLAQAAEKVGAADAVTSVADAAVLTINHPGMMRAFEDVTITAKAAKALTIPIHRLAYGHRAGEFEGLFVLGGKKFDTGKNILAMKDGDDIIPMFLLVHSVHQPQDRSLLPTDEEWQDAAVEGAENYLREALGE
jgi:hypothetical protein